MTPTLSAARHAVAAARTLLELSTATPDARQRAALEAFPGWGPAATLFDPQPGDAWAELADELDDVAGQAMLTAGRVVDTSFFTPAALIGHIYGVLRAALAQAIMRPFSAGAAFDHAALDEDFHMV